MSMLELIKKIFEIAIKIIKELINWIFKNFIKPVFDLIKTVGEIAFAPAQEDKGKERQDIAPAQEDKLKKFQDGFVDFLKNDLPNLMPHGHHTSTRKKKTKTS